VLVAIGPVITGRARWSGEKTNPFIISNSLDLSPRPLREVTNREPMLWHGIDPVVATGSI